DSRQATSTAATRSGNSAISDCGSRISDSADGNQGVLLRPRQLLEGVLALQRLAHRSEHLTVHELHRSSAGRILRAAAVVMGALACNGISRIAGVERPVRAPNHVDVMQRGRISAASAVSALIVRQSEIRNPKSAMSPSRL